MSHNQRWTQRVRELIASGVTAKDIESRLIQEGATKEEAGRAVDALIDRAKNDEQRQNSRWMHFVLGFFGGIVIVMGLGMLAKPLQSWGVSADAAGMVLRLVAIPIGIGMFFICRWLGTLALAWGTFAGVVFTILWTL